MRTYLLATYLNNLSDLNAHWAYSLFSSEQFIIDNTELFDKNEDKFSTAIYHTNRYSNICNWTLYDIKKYRIEQLKFIFNSSYLYAYSVYDIYLDGLIDFIIEIENVINEKDYKRDDSNKGFFKIIEDLYLINPEKIFKNEVIKTHDYLRLRRNIIAHTEITDINISQGLKNITKDYGHLLNKYWHSDEKSSNIDIDFKNIDHIKKIDENQIRQLFRLFRNIGYKLDEIILNQYNRNQIIDYYVNVYKNYLNKKKYKKEIRLNNIIKSHFFREYNETLTDDEISYIKRLT